MYLDGDNRSALTPQLALRVAVIGGVALVAFAVIFFRLWYLQVLSGDKYRAEASANQVRDIKVGAPRGEIVDRQGRVLVDNRTGLAVKVTPDKLPASAAARRAVYDRVARVLGMSGARVARSVTRQLRIEPFTAATVKQDVSQAAVAYLLENQSDFPGVTVERVFLRSYPRREIGAQLVGYVGEVTAEELKQERYRGAQMGDRVGQSGIESQYDRFLRGRNGAARVQVDAFGRLRGELATRPPVQGRQLRLSLDIDVQRAGQQAIGPRRGAFVVMNVRDGQVLALGSSPSFDPNLFAKAVRPSDYARLTAKDNGEPLANRAIQGLYPTGSAFKPITATAALEGGLITPDTVQYDPGFIRVGGVTFNNDNKAVNGALALRRALQVSSDVFFYRLGLEANGRGDGLLIQRWARRLGVARPTGIDLPNELAGQVPSPGLRNRGYAAFRRCVRRIRATPAQISLGECGFMDRPWSVGDNINFAVGQGDLQTNPLQMAVAYAAIANGGRVLKPRLGQRIEDASGRPLQELQAPTARRVSIQAPFRQAILEGLRAAASQPGGTSASVFAGFKIPVAGKTGTAEVGANRAPTSWYCALAPYPSIQYVTCAVIENGGYGAQAAAPAVRKILGAVFNVKESGPIRGGTSRD